MNELNWTDSEKKVARWAFDASLKAELAEIISIFKDNASSARTPDEMWSIGDSLLRQRREIEQKYDYRYSQLLHVFGRLVREGRITKRSSKVCPRRNWETGSH